MELTYRALLMTDYSAYCYHCHGGDWIPSRFHKYICDLVQSFIEKPTDKAYEILILSTPPQHGKSLTITETLPSWYLGRNPKDRVIEVSYGEEFAKRFGRRNRNKIKEFGGEIFGIGIGSPDTDLDFELSNGIGGMISRGIGSGITGQRANLIIIDDPIKNREDADSETNRNKQWDEWENSIHSRFAVGCKIIVIMTRWHEDDLAGRLIERDKEHTTVINLPLEAEENDVLGRKVGDALCPEIGKDNQWLSDFKKGYITESGSRTWNALYQGHPTALEGNLFKREYWKYYEELPQLADVIMSVDAAFKDGDDNDFVAIQVWGKTNADMYLIDAVKKHLNFEATMREIIRLRSLYPQCRTTLIEDKANGSAIISMLRKKMVGIIAVNPIGGKYSRAEAIIGAVESGNVWLPKNKPFTWDFVDECASFPNGAHDDQVDSMTQALNRLIYNSSTIKRAKDIDPIMKYFPQYKTKAKKTGKGSKINVI